MILPFVAGAVVMGFAIAGLFFFKFWRNTQDELFLAFAIAFWLLGICQALLTLSQVTAEERSGYFLLRLAAFVLILIAIWRRNRRSH